MSLAADTANSVVHTGQLSYSQECQTAHISKQSVQAMQSDEKMHVYWSVRICWSVLQMSTSQKSGDG